MRADRLISILLLLQNKGKLTTKQLAQELEVSERTIHRDMEALSISGIPVIAERGKSGGWTLLDKYKTNLTGLKHNEIMSLLISPSLQLLTDLGLAKDWHEARQKILASVPSTYEQNTNDIWNRIHVDTSTWRQSTEKIESFKTMQQAIWDEKKLHIKYERADGQCVERIVNPLGLVAKGSTWYLVAHSNGKFRNYRASRMQSATLTKEEFDRPNDFNLAHFWRSSTTEFINSLPRYEVNVEVSPHIIQRIKFPGRFVQILQVETPLENGWIPVILSFDAEQEAKEYILGFGDQIKIIHPKSLKKQIYDMAKAVVNFYEQEKTL
ncbi:YafY family protein [Cytobacillus sp. IB215316]|uniref:helix-turn-helix transcriptional regulator n=1 Tax=Cytobacillus sp. IB215316 TaxID=3097354 RepID=UPI002A0B8043|nr:YafY family protein [Cytobacillus sp. IB215316]MDX8363190.1 YafY family protein [Cytobacillus sp. IB215316]